MPSPSRRESAVAIVLGPFFGLDPWTAKSWPQANSLTRADRLSVMRATRRGKNIGDPRLAPAVIGYARALRSTKDRVLRWQLSVTLGYCVFLGLQGPALGVHWWWALVSGLAATLAYFIFYSLLGRRWAYSRAARAEQLARQVSQQSPADDT